MYNCVWYLCMNLYGLSLTGWHAWFCITNNRHDVTITTYASLPYMDDDGDTTYETPMFLYFNVKIHLYLCLLVNETKNLQHLDCGRSNTAMHGDKTIQDSAEPRFESCYPPFVAGIDLLRQGVVDFYNHYHHHHHHHHNSYYHCYQ